MATNNQFIERTAVNGIREHITNLVLAVAITSCWSASHIETYRQVFNRRSEDKKVCRLISSILVDRVIDLPSPSRLQIHQIKFQKTRKSRLHILFRKHLPTGKIWIVSTALHKYVDHEQLISNILFL